VSETADYTIGVEVNASDGNCGELSRVVIDPVARSLTHLVVEPRHHNGLARLVPVEIVESAGEEIRLRCSTAEFAQLEEAEEVRFLPEVGEQMGYGAGRVLAWPYYGLGPGIGGVGVGGIGMSDPMQPVTFDRVPPGEVEVRRGEHVHASDGNIGRVQGLVVDPADNHVTHVLLQQGHLWGKKDVAIPIGAVKDVAPDGVQLALTKDEIRDLPAVDLLHRH
jgi:sporulation protein YlmC with PRC-barrel domain